MTGFGWFQGGEGLVLAGFRVGRTGLGWFRVGKTGLGWFRLVPLFSNLTLIQLKLGKLEFLGVTTHKHDSDIQTKC